MRPLTIFTSSKKGKFQIWIDELGVDLEAGTLRQAFVLLGNKLKMLPKEKFEEAVKE